MKKTTAIFMALSIFICAIPANIESSTERQVSKVSENILDVGYCEEVILTPKVEGFAEQLGVSVDSVGVRRRR